MPRVYIAGPMRGLPAFNFPAFDRAAKLGRAGGWEVVSPADLDRQSGFNESSTSAIGPAESRVFAKRDTEALLSFRAEDGDAIALLPGWERSTGAKAELALAKWVGLRVLSALTFRPYDAEIVGVGGTMREPLEFGSCESGLCGLDKDLEAAAICVVADRMANDPNL